MRTITIGRSSHCDIVVPYEGVSRVHAEISIVGNQYIFYDKSKNGSSIGGRMINNERISVAPGANILLSNRIPLPWAQVYALLPLPQHKDSFDYEEETHVYKNKEQPVIYSSEEDSLGIGWGILAFIIPIAGWILYFCWKDKTPHKASQAAKVAWIGFGVNCLTSILSSL